jgi:tetratricopeptide (TPR) repeat protein
MAEPDPVAEDEVARCRAHVAACPADAGAWVALGHALWREGARADALAALEQALLVDPACADAHNNLGNAALELGERDRAMAHYEAALRTRPDHAEGHYNLGNALMAAERADEAIASFGRAIALKPDHAGAHNNLGNALRSRGRVAEGLASYQRALALRPDYTGTRNNMAIALIALHRPAEALPLLAEVLARPPAYPGGHAEAANNLGGALLALDRLEEAAEAFAGAVAADPGLVQARFGMALALLGMGRFAEGWEAYEARWLDPQFRDGRPDPPVPRWNGEDPGGRTILLQAEQGLGDTIQFARYVPMVRARADVVLQVPASLKPLLAPLAPVVVADDETPPPVDLFCPLLSLPRLFGTDLATIPADIPYLRADPRRIARFGYLRPAAGRLRVGVAFSGSASHVDDPLRSIPAADFLPPLLAAGALVHVLQTDLRAADAAVVAALDGVDAQGADIADFADTAALVARMDLVISVDTSVAHLAGAMGKPVWILLQHAADFRWMRHRIDSPWYPTARLFRQRKAGEWGDVLAEVAQALREAEVAT